MTETGIILHSVIQAEDCIKKGLHAGHLLFSTHASVDVHLRERYGISCQCLSEFWDNEEVLAYKKAASQKVERILPALDSQIAPFLNAKLGTQMRYFVPLYAYLGKYCYCGYNFFISSIRKIREHYKINELIIYNAKSNTFFDNPADLMKILSPLFNEIKIDIIEPPKATSTKLQKIKQALEKLLINNPQYILNKIIDLFYKEIIPRIKLNYYNNKNILLLENLYDLNFLRNHLPQYNIFHFLLKGDRFWGKRDLLLGRGWKNLFSAVPLRPLKIPSHLFEVPVTDHLDRIFIADIKEDFLTNIGRHLTDLRSLKAVQKKWPISLAIWGNSPIRGLKALAVEYLRSEGVPILGGQHGALFGDAHEPWHFDSDFNRCDFFVSYGFTGEDLRRLYPEKDTNITILPFGASGAPDNAQIKTPLDILFPLANSMSLFEGGMLRTLPNRLAEAQVMLLEYLDSLTNLDIFIKPPMFSGNHNSAVIPVLQRMKRVKVVDVMTYKSFLKKYYPKIILIEYPSGPLYESLHLDSEIFLLHNPVIPFAQEALNKLQKRVHYCQDVGELLYKLDLFLKGRLEKKRDLTFYHHYIFKPDTQRNILSVIDDLVVASPHPPKSPDLS